MIRVFSDPAELSEAEPPTSWLRVEETDDVVLLTAAGGIAARRAIDLWSRIEHALEHADGRLVAVDLTGVTAFDARSVDEVTLAARAALRRHLDLCAITHPDSPFDQYLRCRALGQRIPIYSSLGEALPAEASAAGAAAAWESVA